MKQNNITPLEQLRQEKEIARQEVLDSEARLSGQWVYMRNNLSVLLVNSVIDTTLKGFGLKSSKSDSNKAKNKDEELQSPGIFKSVLGSMAALSPLIWELVQPMLMSFALKKVKSIFSGGDKKKRKD